MIESLSQPIAQPQAQPRTARLAFVDNLRVALTALVVIHHLAITYSGIPVWYYIEENPNETLLLGMFAFILINQGFFMGLFFLLSAYFTPGSLERKGFAAFLQDRLVRLGIPLVVFAVMIGPLTAMMAFNVMLDMPISWSLYLETLGFGPMWFVELLLAFTLIYAVWRWRAGEPSPRSEAAPLQGRTVVLFTAGLAVVTFLWRILIPMGTWVPVIDFPTMAYLPQYAAMFGAGLVASQRNWFATLSDRMGWIGLGIAIASTLVLFPLASALQPASLGGLTWQSALYSLWDSTFAVGMALGLLVLFRRRFNGAGPAARFLSTHAYAVYVVHAPTIVLLAIAMRGLTLDPLLKFAIAVVIGLPLCYAVAFVVRKLPYASRVL